MKSWPDRLKEATNEQLHAMIKRQRAEVEIARRTLATMEGTLAERCAPLPCTCGAIPRAHLVCVPHPTWTVVCECGERTGYFDGGREYAVKAWNRWIEETEDGGTQDVP